MTLPPWNERPIELANLLNPAFCALLVRDAALGYRASAKQALPYALAYLVLPIALYPPVRAVLPGNTRTLLTTWLQEHVALQFQVASRVPRMLPFSREAILFGLQHRLLGVAEDGGLEPGAAVVSDLFPEETEPARCRSAAGLVGRWFGKMGDPVLVLTLWGLRP